MTCRGSLPCIPVALTSYSRTESVCPRVRFASAQTDRHCHIAGQDATDAFFGLHRYEVLLRPQYARLQIGKIKGEEEQIKPPKPGDLSQVPYAEPSWLSPAYHSPYYNDNHRKFQKAVRTFLMEKIQPVALMCEESGKRIPQETVDQMAYVSPSLTSLSLRVY
jgi:hypothetical protein